MLDFKEELQKISEQRADSQFIDCEKDVSITFEALNGTMAKLLKKQGAMGMQVEEMYAIIEEKDNTDFISELESEVDKMVSTLIAAAELIEDFYLYYREHYEETLTAQSALMWNTVCKIMAVSGLIRIADENTPFNIHLNSIEGVTADTSFANGFIVKVLKSGYLYKGNVCRKAAVIVNKLEEKQSEQNSWN